MEQTEQTPQLLKHFTQVSGLLGILEQGIIPQRTDWWPDRNDFTSVDAYRRLKNAGAVRVFCFASGDEMVHHWFTYASGGTGCCIHFDTEKLLCKLRGIQGLLAGRVVYRSARTLPASELKALPPKEIPFLKRRPYECEHEYRIVWTGGADETPPAIPALDCVAAITTAPDFDEHCRSALTAAVEKILPRIRIQRSRILEEKEKWISKFENL
ncbi:MAG: hypothetical protein Pg6A_11060 [Termitinemataceae bacterium]|nr:MAG: hypothetical protein Pg6A_11060 [Termitinemataceae bacterium]